MVYPSTSKDTAIAYMPSVTVVALAIVILPGLPALVVTVTPAPKFGTIAVTGTDVNPRYTCIPIVIGVNGFTDPSE